MIVDARRALIEATGITPASWPPMPETLPAAPGPIADPDSLLERLPELRALRAEAEAARAGITLAERQRRPDPTVALRGGQEGSDALVGVNVSVPLFIRNTYRAEVNAASSLSVSLEKQLLDAFVAAKARHSAAAETYARLREALQTWEAGGQLALNRRLEILEDLWESGELSASEYLIQTRESLDAELSALEVKRRAWESWFEWLDASAGVNTWLGISEEEAPR
jgi:cobalt-zinc-cadmium efflux system outer membrane protein